MYYVYRRKKRLNTVAISKEYNIKILIVGQKGAGKSTLSAMLVKVLEYKEANLAEALKRACAVTTSLPLKHFYDQEYKEKKFLYPIRFIKEHVESIFLLFGYHVDDFKDYTSTLVQKCIRKECWSIRELLQFVGTDLLREFDPEVHLKFLQKTLPTDAIIADIRFVNEAKFFTDKELCYTTYIERGNAKDDTHVSETQVLELRDKADIIVTNNGSLEELNSIANKIVGEINEKIKI